MRELRVKAALEICDIAHIPSCLALYDEGLLAEPLQSSIVMSAKGGMSATPDDLLHAVRVLPPGALWQIIAVGRAHLDQSAIAFAIGGNARSGLEDTLPFEKGSSRRATRRSSREW